MTVVHGEPVRAAGSSHVQSVTVRENGRERKLKADALVVDALRAPAYELPEQAGAAIAHEPYGFVARTEGGKVRPGVWVVGEAVGTPLDPDVMEEEAERVVGRLLVELEQRGG